MIKLNPELILMRNDEVTIENLAKEYDAQEQLIEYYKGKAERVGLSFESYIKRFNIKLR